MIDQVTSKPDPSETRERLVETARKLFWQQGYAATGVAQILKEADARSGSLYYFFPTKNDLLLAVLGKYREMLLPAVIEPVFSRISDPVERIFGVLAGYRALLSKTNCTAGCPIGNLALELSDANPDVRELIAENFTAWKDQIRGCLDAVAERLAPGVDRANLASFVLTVMEGAVMQCRAYGTLEPFDAAVSQLRDYFDRLQADASRDLRNGKA